MCVYMANLLWTNNKSYIEGYTTLTKIFTQRQATFFQLVVFLRYSYQKNHRNHRQFIRLIEYISIHFIGAVFCTANYCEMQSILWGLWSTDFIIRYMLVIELLVPGRSGCNIKSISSWWHHQMETFSALLALCEGNPPVIGGFLSQKPVMRSFDVFFDLGLKKRLSKQSRRRWVKTPSCSLWSHFFNAKSYQGDMS